MNDPRNKPQDMTPLIDAYLDGTITPEQLAALESWIESSPENAKRFAELSLLERGLHDAGKTSASTAALEKLNAELASRGDEGDIIEAERIPVAKLAPAAESYSIQRARVGRVRSRFYRYAAAAALLITTGIAAWVTWSDRGSSAHPVPSAHTVATLIDVDGAVFVGPKDPPSRGDAMEPGTLALRSGRAQLMFNSTAVVDLDGACAFGMVDLNRGRLASGLLTAYVPPKASGFSLDLVNGARVIDRGTRFIVDADASGAARVTVIEGRVDLDARGAKERLTVGMSRLLGEDGVVRLDRMLPPAPTVDSRLVVTYPPASRARWLERTDRGAAMVVPIRAGYVLPDDLPVTHRVSGELRPTSAGALIGKAPAVVPASTKVDVYLIEVGPADMGGAVIPSQGTIRFNRPIVGIIASDAALAATNADLGDPAIPVSNAIDTSDSVAVSADRRSLSIHWRTAQHGVDSVRVLVEAE
ncbi:MAG: hypothetical protein GC159_10415 [Phycisphaera sp.]|nr:hypothetical protein [Phycisphaera sp.]